MLTPRRHVRHLLRFRFAPAFYTTSSSPSSTAPTALPRIEPTPYTLLTSSATFAKRSPRPFPPPFASIPRSSNYDPSYTSEGAPWLRGLTNGDDALVHTSRHIAVADGVGAWNTRSDGHPSLWSRLLLHFWSRCLDGLPPDAIAKKPESGNSADRERDREKEQQEERARRKRIAAGGSVSSAVMEENEDALTCLTSAYTSTLAATTASTSPSGELVTLKGTTTFCGAVLSARKILLLNLGDSVAWIYRPSEDRWLARTAEQWHFFDCPRQLGTNSPDTPRGPDDPRSPVLCDDTLKGKGGATIVTEVEVEEGDLVVAATDGLTDNLWDHEIMTTIGEVWSKSAGEERSRGEEGIAEEKQRVGRVAEALMQQARAVAGDPFAQSPFMERSLEDGVMMEGGKWDDVSVVVGVVRERGERKDKEGEMGR